MKCYGRLSDSQEYWDRMYDHRLIGEALVQEGSEAAKMRYRSHVERMLGCDADAARHEHVRLFLESLNLGLYNYMLFKLNLSLAECCAQNGREIRELQDTYLLYGWGERIIEQYARQLKQNAADDPYIDRICAYIQNHLEEDLTITYVCEQVYVGRTFFCRNFKEAVGCTFCEYVKRQRIHRAKQLLISTKLSIEQIALKCGFRSSAYFITVFKNETKITPSVFRRHRIQNISDG